MKKGLLWILIFLSTMLLISSVVADETVSPLLSFFQAERGLLFDNDNVTMTGHATFSVDGTLFKTANLAHVQSGTTYMRDWRLTTPNEREGGVKETGYTVVVKDDQMIYAFESYGHGENVYIAEPSKQHNGILRHTVMGDTLCEMTELVLEQCGKLGDSGITSGEDGSKTITITLGEDDIPPIVQTLLNSVLQYGIDRYMGYSYASGPASDAGHYTYYGTISQGLAYCMKSVQLRELQLDAKLDQDNRIQDVICSIVLGYTEKNGQYNGEIKVDMEQHAYDYGTSIVEEDVQKYNHWAKPKDDSQIASTGSTGKIVLDTGTRSQTGNSAKELSANSHLLTDLQLRLSQNGLTYLTPMDVSIAGIRSDAKHNDLVIMDYQGDENITVPLASLLPESKEEAGLLACTEDDVEQGWFALFSLADQEQLSRLVLCHLSATGACRWSTVIDQPANWGWTKLAPDGEGGVYLAHSSFEYYMKSLVCYFSKSGEIQWTKILSADGLFFSPYCMRHERRTNAVLYGTAVSASNGVYKTLSVEIDREGNILSRSARDFSFRPDYSAELYYDNFSQSVCFRSSENYLGKTGTQEIRCLLNELSETPVPNVVFTEAKQGTY